MSDLPECASCGWPLDHVDHYAIQHEIYDPTIELYRPVGVEDAVAPGVMGLASETDLRCGRCGVPIEDREQRAYFYKRWSSAILAIEELKNSTMREVRK